ncbi:MAG: hypothetical protein L0G55_06045, partial [Corynebacterium sp.]|nr:hypothetical protein [Corynebacterium sp.]
GDGGDAEASDVQTEAPADGGAMLLAEPQGRAASPVKPSGTTRSSTSSSSTTPTTAPKAQRDDAETEPTE